jgi:predicted small lipoprotein YifL|tara:strand:- start:591 stop:710 length:120 start_codon:yes stop_codon:yes gene_type:complete
MKKIILIIILSTYLTGCGVKGPLYLPTEDKKEETKETST